MSNFLCQETDDIRTRRLVRYYARAPGSSMPIVVVDGDVAPEVRRSRAWPLWRRVSKRIVVGRGWLRAHGLDEDPFFRVSRIEKTDRSQILARKRELEVGELIK